MNIIQRVIRRVDKSVSSFFFLDQWVILTGQAVDYKSLKWSNFHQLIPDKDRYWGDPFIVAKDHHYYVYVEEKIYSTGLGRIACLTLDGQGRLLANEVVLECPYHLSYPFIFEFAGELFMLPETAQNRTLELYRCTRFPGQWEFERTLMTDIYAVDATLLSYDNKWWLFANVKEQGGSSLDSLYLYYADQPLTDHWISHPGNPIVKDMSSARPAGWIFRDGASLIRPSQDNSRRYGRAIKFNRILRLSENEYEEAIDFSFGPPQHTKILATHTFNQAGGLTAIDAVIRRWKFGA